MDESLVRIEVHWRYLDDSDEGWNQLECLYAYQAPHTREILYIGKAWGVTVRARWNRSGKESFWDDLERDRGLKMHQSLLGELALPPGTRLTHELLCDVESLLIYEVQPWGNIQSRSSRIERPGLVVDCRGTWPASRRQFCDAR